MPNGGNRRKIAERQRCKPSAVAPSAGQKWLAHIVRMLERQHKSFLQPPKIQIAIGNTRAALHSNFIAYMLKNKTLFIHGLLQHSLPCKSGHEGMTPNVWWRLQLLMALHVLHCHLQTHSLFIDFKSTIDKLLKKKTSLTQWFISSLFSSCRMAFPSVYIVNVYFLSHWIWAGTSLLALMLQSETAGTMTRLKSFSRRWKCARSRLCRPVDDNHTGMRNPIIHTEMKSWEHKTPGLEDITQQSPSFFAPLADNRLPPFIHNLSSLFLPRKKERLKIHEQMFSLQHTAGAVQSKMSSPCVLNASCKSKPHWNNKKGPESQSFPFLFF